MSCSERVDKLIGTLADAEKGNRKSRVLLHFP